MTYKLLVDPTVRPTLESSLCRKGMWSDCSFVSLALNVRINLF